MRKRKDLYWGFMFIFLGTTMLLNMFGVFGDYDIFKIAWTIIVVSYALKSLFDRDFVLASLSAAVIVHINKVQLGVSDNIMVVYAAAIFIGVGLSSLFKGKKKGGRVYVNGKSYNYRQYRKENSSEDVLEGEQVYYTNNLGENIRYVKSDNLKEATIENNLGSSRVYFDNVTFSDQGCSIYVECNLGQIIVYLPKHINLENNITTALGSLKGPSQLYSGPDAPTVRINGEVNLGEVRIELI